MFGYLQGQNKSFNLIDLVRRRNRNNSLKTSFINETVTAREQNFGLLHLHPPLLLLLIDNRKNVFTSRTKTHNPLNNHT